MQRGQAIVPASSPYLVHEKWIQARAYTDVILRWEMIKLDIRGFALQFGARKNNSEIKKLEVLYQKQYQVKAALDSKDFSVFNDHQRQLTLITKDIEETVQERANKASEASQTNWLRFGEKIQHITFHWREIKPRFL